MNHLLDRIGLAVGSIGALAIASLLAYAAFANPQINRVMTVGPAVVFAVLGVLCGYRTFSPDQWFSARDQKSQEWCARHPLLSTILVILSLASIVWEIIREIVQRVSP